MGGIILHYADFSAHIGRCFTFNETGKPDDFLSNRYKYTIQRPNVSLIRTLFLELLTHS